MSTPEEQFIQATQQDSAIAQAYLQVCLYFFLLYVTSFLSSLVMSFFTLLSHLLSPKKLNTKKSNPSSTHHLCSILALFLFTSPSTIHSPLHLISPSYHIPHHIISSIISPYHIPIISHRTSHPIIFQHILSFPNLS
jgi:hypothetical protein